MFGKPTRTVEEQSIALSKSTFAEKHRNESRKLSRHIVDPCYRGNSIEAAYEQGYLDRSCELVTMCTKAQDFDFVPRKLVPVHITNASIVKAWSLCTFIFSFNAIVAWIAYISDPNNLTIFASVTSLAYCSISVVLCVSRVNFVKIHPIIFGLGVICACLGAASFSFHADAGSSGTQLLGTPQHSFDIMAGWLLFIYLAIMTSFTTFATFVKERRAGIELMIVLIMLAIAATIAMTFYDSVKISQMDLFFTTGTIMYLTTFITRYKLSRCDYSKYRSLLISLYDVISLVAVQGICAVLQGGRFSNVNSISTYNITHGYWHLGTSLIVNMIAVYMLQSLSQVCVPSFSRGEVFIQICTWIFFGMLLILTLSNVSIQPLTYTLGISQIVLLILSYSTLFGKTLFTYNMSQIRAFVTNMIKYTA